MAETKAEAEHRARLDREGVLRLSEGSPRGTSPHLREQVKKEALRQAFRDQLLETTPEVETLIPELEEAEPPRLVEGSSTSTRANALLDGLSKKVEHLETYDDPKNPEAAATARKAKVQALGRKLGEAQALYLQKAVRNTPMADDPDGYQQILKEARWLTARKRPLSWNLYEALNIDAMQRWGKRYAGPTDLAANYTQDAAAHQAEVKASFDARPTQFPNALMQVVDNEGEEVARNPGWVGPTNETTSVFRGGLVRSFSGDPRALSYGAEISEETALKSQAGGVSPENAKRMGFLRAEKIIATPFAIEGPAVGRNVRLYADRSDDGTWGISPRAYQELFELHWRDYLLRKRGLGSVNNPREGAEAVWEEAKELARRDVVKLMSQNQAKGHVIVDLDPEGTTEAIVKGEIGILGNLDIRAMRAIGADNIADMLARGRAPLVALAHPVVGLSPNGEISYGRSILDVQTEHPAHWFLRSGGWTMLLSWYLNADPDMEWGGLKHIRELRQGYDYTQDAPEIGKRLAAKTPWVDSETFQKVAGISAVIALALVEPDLPSFALLGVMKPFAVATKAGRAATAISAAQDTARTLRVLEASGSYADLEKALRNPLLDKTLTAGLSSRLAREGLEVDVVQARTIKGAADEMKAAARKHAETAQKEARQKEAEAWEAVVTEADKMAGAWAKTDGQGWRSAVQDPSAAHIVSYADDLATGRIAPTDLLAQQFFANHGAKIEAILQQKAAKAAAQKATLEEGLASAYATYRVNLKELGRVAGKEAVEYETKKLTLENLLRQAEHAEQIAKTNFDALVKIRGLSRADVRVLTKQKITPKDAAKVLRLRPSRKPATAWRRSDYASPLDLLRDIGAKTVIDGYTSARLARGALQKDLAKLKVSHGESTQAGLRVVKAARKGVPKLRKTTEAARAAVVAATQKMLDANQRILDVDELVSEIIRDVAGQQANALDSYVKLVLEGKPTHIDELGTFTFRDSVAQQLLGVSTEQTGTSILRALTKSYGPRRFLEAGRDGRVFEHVGWGPATENRFVREMVARGDGDVLLDAHTANALFRAETAIRQGAWLKRELGDAVLGSAMARMLFDPDAPFMAWKMGRTPAAWTAEGFRVLEGLKKILSPSKEMFGLAGRRLNDVGRTAIEHHDGIVGEVTGMFQYGHSVEDVLGLLTTRIAYPLRDGTITTSNMEPLTLFEKWREYVLGRLAAEAGRSPDMTPEALARVLSGDREIKALEVIVRSGLPSLKRGSQDVSGVRHRIIRSLQNPTPGASPREQLQELIDISRKGFGRKGRWEVEVRAFRDAIQGIALGAVLRDFHEGVKRTLGPLTAEHARAWNHLLDGGQHTQHLTGKPRDIDPHLAYEAGELMGASMGSPNMRRAFDDIWRADQVMHKWADHHPGLGFAPTQIVAFLEKKAGRIVKELEPRHNRPTLLDRAWTASHIWANWWRRSVVMGLALPRLAHFTNTFFGDMSQVIQTRGWRQAGKLMASNAFTYIPYGGRAFQSSLSDRARSGGLMAKFINPHLGAVMRGDDSYRIATADGLFTPKELLYQGRHEDGVFDFILTQDIAEATRRLDKPMFLGVEGTLERISAKWPRLWTNFMMDIQARHRMAIYLEDRVNFGLTKIQAKKNIHEVAYDWKHGATEMELRTVAKISAFYMFWRNAYNQMGMTLMEPLTMPAYEYAKRAATGRTKLARVRQQGQIMMAAPEWWWWWNDELEGPNEILSDAQQLEAFQKRETPWWIGARSWLPGGQLDRDERDWHRRERGTAPTHWVGVLPMLTALDTLYLTALMAQTAMAAGNSNDNVELSARWGDDMSEEILGKLGPMFEFFGEAMVNKATGRAHHPATHGVPLRGGEEDILRWLGLIDIATVPDPEGRRYVDRDTAELVTLVIRATAVVGTELPVWATAYNNPSWERGAVAGAAHMLQNLSGFGRKYAHDPLKNHSHEAKRLESMFNDLNKKGKRRERADYKRGRD